MLRFQGMMALFDVNMRFLRGLDALDKNNDHGRSSR
jgi:hypothetical protein